jgi:hypothetical protein
LRKLILNLALALKSSVSGTFRNFSLLKDAKRITSKEKGAKVFFIIPICVMINGLIYLLFNDNIF